MEGSIRLQNVRCFACCLHAAEKRENSKKRKENKQYAEDYK